MAQEPVEHTVADTRRRGTLMAALFMLAASSLLVEVLLTKLFANKLDHHFTFAIIGMAMLGFGAAGVFVQLRAHVFRADETSAALAMWRYALAYTAALLVGVTAFVVLPLNPDAADWSGYAALPVYFILFATIFFLAGVCVSILFTARGISPARVYLWDLLGAGLGAALGPPLLSSIGAYGSTVFAASLSLSAALLIRTLVRKGAVLACAFSVVVFLSGAACALQIPRERLTSLGLEVAAFKSPWLRGEFLASFNGAALSFWNPIARIDVSHTGTSMGSFRWGMPQRTIGYPLEGRMILVDGAAFTRQYALKGTPDEVDSLRNTLWATPYVVRQDPKRTLLLGPGGGIDILIGKLYGVREIDALELNPDTFALLNGRPEDLERERYVPWLRSDAHTRVTLRNVEGRHYVHAKAARAQYDVVLATGVDTLTAIGALGNSLNENFLYTRNAVEDYMSLLRPGGVLALTHWEQPWMLPIRLFNTYLDALRRAGVAEPEKRVVVISGNGWDDLLLKKDADFTVEEIARLRGFAAYNNYRVIYDPFLTPDAPVIAPDDAIFRRLARARGQERAQLLAAIAYDISPATDARPYFYWLRPTSASVFDSDAGGFLFPVPSIRVMFYVTLLLCLGLAIAPAFVLSARKVPVARSVRALPFFALAGLGFILTENALFMQLTLFVGGPLYSLSVVLPAILVGYSVGSLVAARFIPRARVGGFLLMVAYALGFLGFAFVAPHVLAAFMGSDTTLRVAVAACLVAPFGVLLGLCVPWYMEIMQADQRTDGTLAWMWGVNSAGNVIGSMMFVPLCHAVGVRDAFGVAGAFYLLALLWAIAVLGAPLKVARAA